MVGDGEVPLQGGLGPQLWGRCLLGVWVIETV